MDNPEDWQVLRGHRRQHKTREYLGQATCAVLRVDAKTQAEFDFSLSLWIKALERQREITLNGILKVDAANLFLSYLCFIYLSAREFVTLEEERAAYTRTNEERELIMKMRK